MLERRLYRDGRRAGVLYAVALVAPAVAVARWLDRRLAGPQRTLLGACAAWAALGGRMLRRTASELAELIDRGELDAARELAPALVARRTEALDAAELARAAIESLAENTADAVGGPLLWSALAGPAGAVAHRAVNTLDAMVGYHSRRYARFGWCAARLDDALGWPVARATAAAAVLAAAVCGEDPGGALRTWRRDARRHPSPNAGRPEAVFAGALGVTLGGANAYGNVVEHRPLLGYGPAPDAGAVRRAVRMSAVTSHLLAAAAVAGTWR